MSENEIISLGSDIPKSTPEEDALGYAPFARQIAKAIRTTPSPQGLIMAIHGPWGSGKSTLLNFVKHELSSLPDNEKVIVVDFNPWWFNDKNHLVGQFLGRFHSALKLDPNALQRIGNLMGEYNTALATTAATSLSVPWAAGGVAWLLGKFRAKTQDVPELKAKIAAVLKNFERRILFVVDDIDRLTPDEIRELFKVIKALADFPNVVYLLSFDRHVVHLALEKALGVDGAAYLEKIVQVPFSLPSVDRGRLRKLFFKNMDALLTICVGNKFDSSYWQNVYLEGIDQFILKPRDVVRLTNALFVSYPAVAGEVNFADFVALESLRVFEPRMYELVRDNREMFAGHSDQNRDPADSTRQFHDAWLSDLPIVRRPAMKALLSRMFPKVGSSWGGSGYGSDWNGSWRADLRACSPELYDTYFQFGVPADSLSRAELNLLVAAAENDGDVEGILINANEVVRSNGTTKAGEYLDRVRDIRAELSLTAAKGLLKALFNVGDVILQNADGGSGMFRLPLHWWLVRTVDQLLDCVPPDDRLTELLQLVTDAAALGLSVYVVDRIRQHLDKPGERPGDALASFDATQFEELKTAVLHRLEQMPSEDFLGFRDLMHVLYAWRRWAGDAPARDKISPLFTRAELLPILLDQFKRESTSQVIGDSAVTRNISVDPKNIGDFADLDVTAHAVCAMLIRSDLTEDQRTAGASFLKNFDRIRSGESIDD